MDSVLCIEQFMEQQLGIEVVPELYNSPGWMKLHHDKLLVNWDTPGLNVNFYP